MGLELLIKLLCILIVVEIFRIMLPYTTRVIIWLATAVIFISGVIWNVLLSIVTGIARGIRRKKRIRRRRKGGFA